MTVTSLLILIISISHWIKLNKLVTALFSTTVTLELYIILLIFMIAYVVCDYTIPNKAYLVTY